MAFLRSDNLILEYKIEQRKPPLYTMAKLRFLYRETEVLNPGLIREGGYFGVLEDSDSGLIACLESVLDSDRFDAFECVDGRVQIGIYPDEFFPFLGHRARGMKQVDLVSKKVDFFTVIALVGDISLEGFCSTIDGVSLHLGVSRDALEDFVRELREEYEVA